MCIRDSLIFLSIRHNQKKQQVIMLVYFPSYFISMFAQQHHYEPNILLRMKKNIHLIMLSLIHISEPTRPLYISYAVFCLKKKKKKTIITVPYYLYTVHTTITIRKRQR
eukprot:TRINITY_DN2358_c0_g1_i3.p1 TRINITY_DN2358_c0_g1~~TRINITY_DN2358_c0_g1_i3.p1  ORF type:complete len:109 (+),score=16.48 TRINITY_DN2358_c0_g1_i3:136-462(+)